MNNKLLYHGNFVINSSCHYDNSDQRNINYYSLLPYPIAIVTMDIIWIYPAAMATNWHFYLLHILCV